MSSTFGGGSLVCILLSWKNARRYDMGPKIKRKQAFFHDESTFFGVFSAEA